MARQAIDTELSKVLRLADCIFTTSQIQCNKCNRHNQCGYGENDAADYFYSLGWREKDGVCYCPSCVMIKHIDK